MLEAACVWVQQETKAMTHCMQYVIAGLNLTSPSELIVRRLKSMAALQDAKKLVQKVTQLLQDQDSAENYDNDKRTTGKIVEFSAEDAAALRFRHRG